MTKKLLLRLLGRSSAPYQHENAMRVCLSGFINLLTFYFHCGANVGECATLLNCKASEHKHCSKFNKLLVYKRTWLYVYLEIRPYIKNCCSFIIFQLIAFDEGERFLIVRSWVDAMLFRDFCVIFASLLSFCICFDFVLRFRPSSVCFPYFAMISCCLGAFGPSYSVYNVGDNLSCNLYVITCDKSRLVDK